MSALLIQSPGDTVQTGTGKVDPARKFKCTTTTRDLVGEKLCVKIWKDEKIKEKKSEEKKLSLSRIYLNICIKK